MRRLRGHILDRAVALARSDARALVRQRERLAREYFKTQERAGRISEKARKQLLARVYHLVRQDAQRMARASIRAERGRLRLLRRENKNPAAKAWWRRNVAYLVVFDEPRGEMRSVKTRHSTLLYGDPLRGIPPLDPSGESCYWAEVDSGKAWVVGAGMALAGALAWLLAGALGVPDDYFYGYLGACVLGMGYVLWKVAARMADAPIWFVRREMLREWAQDAEGYYETEMSEEWVSQGYPRPQVELSAESRVRPLRYHRESVNIALLPKFVGHSMEQHDLKTYMRKQYPSQQLSPLTIGSLVLGCLGVMAILYVIFTSESGPQEPTINNTPAPIEWIDASSATTTTMLWHDSFQPKTKTTTGGR